MVKKCEVGDLVCLCGSRNDLGVVVEISDAWRRGEVHHVRVCWSGSSSVWVSVEELEIISKIAK